MKDIFKQSKYSEKIRIKPAKKKMLQKNYQLLGKSSPAALMDEIIEDYFKPNLFKKKN